MYIVQALLTDLKKIDSLLRIIFKSDNYLTMFIFRVQTCGVGGLRHNTVMMSWPQGWRHETEEKHYKVFIGETVISIAVSLEFT